MDKETILSALKTIKYPGFSRDIVSFGLVRDLNLENGKASVVLNVTTADQQVPATLKREAEAALNALDGLQEAEVSVVVSAPKGPPRPENNGGGQKNKIQGVRHTIAVASGKGGVGKSTFTVNLACALEREFASRGRSKQVGIMDCDIYGPSIPLMIGINQRPEVEGNMIRPLENFGVRVMSMGVLIDENTPVVWRGPMVTKTIMQFAQNVNWGELEFLIVDLPPGTGDAQLTLAQTIALDGAVIVTTPQVAAVNVARRGAQMFEKVNVPILGVVENMSYLEEPESGRKQFIFGQGGGETTAKDLHTSLLGQVPLYTEIREGGDNGIPVTIGMPASGAAKVFEQIAKKVLDSFDY